MSSILDKIVAAKREEIAENKKSLPLEQFPSMPLFPRKCNSLKEKLLLPGSSGIIAEFKQKSPSGGVINETVRVEEVTRGYAASGAAGISVLTDYSFFGGSLENLLKARIANPDMPLLRKDFMVEEYQLYEAKAHGADVILLIAACLSRGKAEELTEKAIELGMEVLFEIHGADELKHIPGNAGFVGVNNRDLKTMVVSLETSLHLAPLIPDHYVKISESGLSEPAHVKLLKAAGFRGFLIGEKFMRTSDPEIACREFILELNENRQWKKNNG